MPGPKPTLILILDGWGVAPAAPGNAVALADMPRLRAIQAANPAVTLRCSGRAVGLPAGFMGNSEVGHMNIGAGRVVYQDMTRIDLAVEDGSLRTNPALTDLVGKVRASGGALHFLGLLSDGGVHSHQNHLYELLRLAREAGIARVYVHAFMDGRDTPPSGGVRYMRELADFLAREQAGRVATVTGRYYAMDRDKRYERNLLAWDGLTRGQGQPYVDPVQAVEAAYGAGETDEFIKPRILTENGCPVGTIADGDGVFFFNFRADRARQLVRAFFDPAFDGFERVVRPALAGLATMTVYDATFGLPAAFPPQSLDHILGQVVAESGLRQLRIAETEKYAHVTYFFNGGAETPLPGEERVLIPSPREVATYDLKPEMSAFQVADRFIQEWTSGGYGFGVLNFANLDMVGHTGIIPAAVKACETVDVCASRVIETVLACGGQILLTADHGNAEEMIDSTGGPQTAHSLNPVPFVVVGSGPLTLRTDGVLGDIAPTALELMNLPQPAAMTGRSLIQH